MSNFNIKQPFSGLREPNGATYMIMQRQENINNSIKLLITYYRQGYDINNDELQDEIFDLCGLDNPTVGELEYISKKVREDIYGS